MIQALNRQDAKDAKDAKKSLLPTKWTAKFAKLHEVKIKKD